MMLRRTRPTHSSVSTSAVRARWCLDVRFGYKQKASTLLVEWVQQIGSVAGLTASNTRLSTGAVGVPESRIEMEVTFESLGEWEAFLAAVPSSEHVQWSQRMQQMVVDGSPTWQVYRSMDVWGGSSSSSNSSSSQRSSNSSLATPALIMADKVPFEDIAAWHAATSSNRDTEQKQQQQQQQDQAAPAEPGTAAPDLPLDWKGEPMRINPGDKLPFKFL